MSGFLLTLGVAGVGAYALSRQSSTGGLAGVLDLVAHPGAFGVAAGVGNGILATVREKPMSLLANLVTAAVIGISEGILTQDRDAVFRVTLLSGLGAAAGMAPFTRFDPNERALFENKAIPLEPA